MEKQTKKPFLKKIPSIVGVVVCVLLAPILVMNLTIVVKSYLSPDKTPDFFGIKPFVVLTDSMKPTICGGDLVITRTVDPALLKEGDIISFKDGRSVITHRIAGLTEKDGTPAFITRGDGNNTEDANPVLYAQVESIYLFKIAGLGRVAMFMQTPAGLLIFVGIPLCAFILYDVLRRRFAARATASETSAAEAEIARLRGLLEEKEDRQD